MRNLNVPEGIVVFRTDCIDACDEGKRVIKILLTVFDVYEEPNNIVEFLN